ncbi:hypothetical protein SAMN02745176_03333 [Lutispora thermophila DSM 19022]|uniref:DUF6199 domain-containing protein n=1 Tax=Lutispora thermophila DSM 19022 TaxID=1122184 RepID=A0A1M6INC9_9FIRM|nr:hypothetical protein SAMN02745176_03333 [Lutispora thermophila DSM 19022]
MIFTKLLLITFVFLPIIIALLHGIINPKSSFLLGKIWKIKNEIEPTDFVLDLHKIFCIAMLIIVIIMLFIMIIS